MRSRLTVLFTYRQEGFGKTRPDTRPHDADNESRSPYHVGRDFGGCGGALGGSSAYTGQR